mgnify:CR=1 FL=1
MLVFASELKGLLASGIVPREMDIGALGLYLTLGYVPPPATMLAGVRALPPGSCLIVEEGREEESAYWDLPRAGAASDLEKADEVERIAWALDQPSFDGVN